MRHNQDMAMQYLKEWREHRNLSQARAAELSGLAQPVIQRIESGARKYNAEHLEALAKAYNCTPADLISRDPSAEEPTEEAEIVDIWNHILPENRGQARQILETFANKKKA